MKLALAGFLTSAGDVSWSFLPTEKEKEIYTLPSEVLVDLCFFFFLGRWIQVSFCFPYLKSLKMREMYI